MTETGKQAPSEGLGVTRALGVWWSEQCSQLSHVAVLSHFWWLLVAPFRRSLKSPICRVLEQG